MMSNNNNNNNDVDPYLYASRKYTSIAQRIRSSAFEKPIMYEDLRRKSKILENTEVEEQKSYKRKIDTLLNTNPKFQPIRWRSHIVHPTNLAAQAKMRTAIRITQKGKTRFLPIDLVVDADAPYTIEFAEIQDMNATSPQEKVGTFIPEVNAVDLKQVVSASKYLAKGTFDRLTLQQEFRAEHMKNLDQELKYWRRVDQDVSDEFKEELPDWYREKYANYLDCDFDTDDCLECVNPLKVSSQRKTTMRSDSDSEGSTD